MELQITKNSSLRSCFQPRSYAGCPSHAAVRQQFGIQVFVGQIYLIPLSIVNVDRDNAARWRRCNNNGVVVGGVDINIDSVDGNNNIAISLIIVKSDKPRKYNKDIYIEL